MLKIELVKSILISETNQDLGDSNQELKITRAVITDNVPLLKNLITTNQ